MGRMVATLNRSRKTALVAVFAALTVVLDSLMGIPQLQEGVWYSWVFVIEPLNGLVLGPYFGFVATLIGVLVGHQIYFRGSYELLFTLGAPIGAMASGFIVQRKLKPVIAYYVILLSAYFLSPVSWKLPIWGMWDTYLGFLVLLLILLLLRKREALKRHRRLEPILFLTASFVGLEADILFRIFIFVPCGTYQVFYGFNVEILKLIWMAGAVITPVQVAISLLIVFAVGLRLKKILKEMKLEF